MRDDREYLYKDLAKNPNIENIEIPNCILNGIAEKYVLREYQKNALKNFICYFENKSFYQKNIIDDLFLNKNHLLFNIATGGGKTLLMACIILYMHYEYGYNNFLFLSHLNSINTKTEENFFNKSSSKYLFSDNENIVKNGSFYFDNSNNININISTYQSLASLLKTPKENAFNLKDIKDKKIVIIADEAHHLNKGIDKDSGIWEDGVNRVLNNNSDNFLFEFTATINWENLELYRKYHNKCVYRYDLRNFYDSGYTKFIDLIQRDVDIENLMIGAVILSKYRQALFDELGVNMKPVILFKSKTINDSKENHKKFNELIEDLNGDKLEKFYNVIVNNDNNQTKVAFEYLKEKYLDLSNILKIDFSYKNILNTNSDNEVDSNAVLLNTLENKENNIRVIFSVDKLNEGWDVLNLFDIVKLYKTQTTTETTREAQLIGRGARYCAFEYEDKDKYKRKFDQFDKYSILEQLYFHSSQDNMAIAKLKKELENIGFKFEKPQKIEIKMKEKFFNDFKNKSVFVNKKINKKLRSESYNIFDNIRQKFNFQKIPIVLNSNMEKVFHIMDSEDLKNNISKDDGVLVKLSDIENYIKWDALINNINYDFSKLGKRLLLSGFQDFINELDNIEINVVNWKNTNEYKYLLYSFLLKEIYDKIISKEVKKFEGTKEFEAKKIGKVFRNYITKKLLHEEMNFMDSDYIVYDKGDLTSEENSFIKFFKLKIYNKLTKNGYKNIYLLRNEQDLKLFQFKNGIGFEPDFILFLNKENINYQIFIEPKGDTLLAKDEDKNEFLKQISELFLKNKLQLNFKKNSKFRTEDSIIEIEEKSYKLIGLQFYNENIEINEQRMANEIEKYLIEIRN